MTETQTAPRRKHKEFTGVVTSNKMVKTIVVQVTRKVRHPIYHRVVTRSKKFKVHDEKNAAKQGDTVRFVETRPLSKDKRWRLLEILKRGVETIEEKELS